MRFCAAGHEVIVGSRDATRAARVADRLRLWHATGAANADAARAAEIAVLAIPYEGHAEYVHLLAGDLSGRIVVDATVPMRSGYAYAPPPAGSAAAETQALVPGARVVAAFHTLSGRLLGDLERPLAQDVLVCGDDGDARAQVCDLVGSIGARGVDAGALTYASTIEALAVLLISLNVRYRRRHLGILIAHLAADAQPQ
jgi:hypothetical protein